MKVVAVIPTFNERKNIRLLIPKVFQVFRKNRIEGSVVIVDDNSKDGTPEEVEKLSKKYRIFLIRREKKMGLGSAYIEGFKKALELRPSIIFQMDADLSHDPSQIPVFIEKIKGGADLVVGCRYEGLDLRNWKRKFLTRVANFIGKKITRLKIEDLTSGYRAYKREVIERIGLDKLTSKGFEFQVEILLKSKNFEMASIPITFKERKFGKSKLGIRDMIGFTLVLLKYLISSKLSKQVSC